MTYAVKFKSSVEKDLRKIGQKEGVRILQDIQKKLTKDPKKGIPLKGSNNELWRYRVGDYRVIYSFNDEELWILVIHIAHRKEVYR